MATAATTYRSFVVANPKAGAGTVEREWPLLERLLRAQLPEFDYAFTEGPQHATLLTREALRAGWEMVVSVGGDGTLNEVINGFWEPIDGEAQFGLDDMGWMVRHGDPPGPINPQAALGLIPIGTGGDFRRSIGLMGGPAEAIEHLGGRKTRRIDVGQMGFFNHDGEIASRMFVNIASAGMSGLIDDYVNRTWKGFGGKTSFVIGTLRGYFAWEPTDMEFRLDETDEHLENIQNLVVANGEFFGAGMWVAPGAEIDDGEFQVVCMSTQNFRDSIATLRKIYSGEHISQEGVWRKQARTVAARPKNPEDILLIDLDGEQPGRLPVLWSNLSRTVALKI